jgi:hypothetical protein
MRAAAVWLTGLQGARRFLLQGPGDAGDWELARALRESGAEQIDIMVDQRLPETLWSVREEYGLDASRTRWICSSIYNFWDDASLTGYDAVLLRGLQHHPDPLEALVRMRSIDADVIGIETTLVRPFQSTALDREFSLVDGQRIFAPRIGPNGLRAMRDYFASRDIVIPQIVPEAPPIDEIGEQVHPGWLWYFTPGGMRDLLSRARWEVEAEIPIWGDNASFFFCRQRRQAR